MKHPPLFLIVAPVALIGAALVFFFFNHLTAEAWSAVAAFMTIGVGLIAAFVAWHQIESNERNARLSVKPHCVLIGVGDNWDNAPHGLTLRNNGPGTAIIKEWKFFRQGKLLPERNLESLKKLLGVYRLSLLVQGMLLPPGTSIGANRDEKMFYVPVDVGDQIALNNQTARKTIDVMLKEVTISLTYTSVYEDEEFHVGSHDDKMIPE